MFNKIAGYLAVQTHLLAARARENLRGNLRDAEAGMATAEYAIVTIAAVAFAGLLIAIFKSTKVKGILFGLIERALSV